MLIQLQKNLADAVAAVKDSQFIALDTEFLRTKTYYPILCLIQISNGKEHFIIDALADLDLSPVADLLFDKDIVKVIHSARQDMEVLFNQFGFLPKNIFDTQIAMQFLGFQDPPSYDVMINHYTSQKIDKKLQFSNWQKRPLDKDQLIYALSDVVHLAAVYPQILQDIEIRDRANWLKEECLKMETFSNFIPSLPAILSKFSNFLDKEQEFLKCLKLITAREKIAVASNQERSRVIPNELVVQISKGHTSIERIARIGIDIPSFDKAEMNESEKEIVAHAMANKQMRAPRRDARYNLCKATLVDIAKKEEISSTLIANSDDILKLSNGYNKTKLNTGWRYELVGKKLLSLL